MSDHTPTVAAGPRLPFIGAPTFVGRCSCGWKTQRRYRDDAHRALTIHRADISRKATA